MRSYHLVGITAQASGTFPVTLTGQTGLKAGDVITGAFQGSAMPQDQSAIFDSVIPADDSVVQLAAPGNNLNLSVMLLLQRE